MFDWLPPFRVWSADAARESILSGNPPARMRVSGALRLANTPRLRALPRRLSVPHLDVSECQQFRWLPQRLRCQTLEMRRTAVENLPPTLLGVVHLDARQCRRLWQLTPISCTTLLLSGAESLERVPEGMRARSVSLADCPRLIDLPASLAKSVEHLDLSNCASLLTLPDSFAELKTLNLRGCQHLFELPEGLRVKSWIEVSGSGLRELPWSLRSTRLLWRGVPVPPDVAFHPETISVEEILSEENAELRRVLLERVGMEWFIEHAGAEQLDADLAAGGPRRLLRICMAEETLVCVQVQCPSTANRYILRVPPETRTCRQAIAWTAGFSDPDHYQPIQET